jgi:hypothetical protein
MKNALKNNSVMMIKMKMFNDSMNELFENIVMPEMGKIFEEEDEKFIAVEEFNGQDVMFLFVEDHKVKSFLNLLNEHNMVEFSKEVSEEILMGDLEEEFINMMQSDEFKAQFDSFIMKHLDVDMVLDKINFKGMDSLTDNDKAVLEQAA